MDGKAKKQQDDKEQETTDETTDKLESQTMESEKTKDDKEQENTLLPMVEKSSPPTMGKKLEVIIPSSGESITEVEIGCWFKKDGEFVKKGEEILELESEKANLTVSADITGILSIRIQEGETARVGDIAAVIVETSETSADSPNAPDEKKPDAKKPDAPKEAISKETTPPEGSPEKETPNKKIRYQFIHIMNNQKNKKTSEGDSAEPENKDHLAYLTSS